MESSVKRISEINAQVKALEAEKVSLHEGLRQKLQDEGITHKKLIIENQFVVVRVADIPNQLPGRDPNPIQIIAVPTVWA